MPRRRDVSLLQQGPGKCRSIAELCKFSLLIRLRGLLIKSPICACRLKYDARLNYEAAETRPLPLRSKASLRYVPHLPHSITDLKHDHATEILEAGFPAWGNPMGEGLGENGKVLHGLP